MKGLNIMDTEHFKSELRRLEIRNQNRNIYLDGLKSFFEDYESLLRLAGLLLVELERDKK